MGILSPPKLLIVLIVAVVVLGPDKLPRVARQLGAAWGQFRQWRARLESEVRGSFPDLPPTSRIAEAVRSPLTFLDRLADEHERALAAEQSSGSADPAGSAEPGPYPAVVPPPAGNGSARDGSPGSAGAGNASAASLADSNRLPGHGTTGSGPADGLPGRRWGTPPGAVPSGAGSAGAEPAWWGEPAAVPDDPSMN